LHVAVALDPAERTLSFEHADGDPRFAILVSFHFVSRPVSPRITEIIDSMALVHGSERARWSGLITKTLRRITHGMRNFDNHRLPLLLHSGVQWNTPPTARIKGRQPRTVA
jgi:hypothetical protein